MKLLATPLDIREAVCDTLKAGSSEALVLTGIWSRNLLEVESRAR